MTQAANKAERQRRASPHVLVVDDDRRFCELLVRLLGPEGFVVEGALTIADALHLLKARAFDVVLCDWRLPDGTGRALLEAALQVRPIKGIAISGLAGEEDILASRAAGFVEHLPKPVLIEDIVAAIQRALNGPAEPGLSA